MLITHLCTNVLSTISFYIRNGNDEFVRCTMDANNFYRNTWLARAHNRRYGSRNDNDIIVTPKFCEMSDTNEWTIYVPEQNATNGSTNAERILLLLCLRILVRKMDVQPPRKTHAFYSNAFAFLSFYLCLPLQFIVHKRIHNMVVCFCTFGVVRLRDDLYTAYHISFIVPNEFGIQTRIQNVLLQIERELGACAVCICLNFSTDFMLPTVKKHLATIRLAK